MIPRSSVMFPFHCLLPFLLGVLLWLSAFPFGEAGGPSNQTEVQKQPPFLVPALGGNQDVQNPVLEGFVSQVTTPTHTTAGSFLKANPLPGVQLQFLTPVHEPRIYMAAPSGVPVTRVVAASQRYPDITPTYRLHGNSSDNVFFQIHAESGNITSRMYIDRPVGRLYSIVVAADLRGDTEYIQLSIRVTEYNRYPPIFTTSNYVVMVDVLAPVGSILLRVRALDKDVQPYNSEVYYSMQKQSLVALNETTGHLMLKAPLPSRYSNLTFTVMAHDGGSPRRQGRAKVTLIVKIISAPLNVTIVKTGHEWAMLCWSPPRSGQPLGYLIFINSTASTNGSSTLPPVTETVVLNVSLVQLGLKDGRLCKALENLTRNNDYEVVIIGRNLKEIGLPSTPVPFNTKVNITCRSVVNGEFICSCLPGFYGEDCSLYNPCNSEKNPCYNGGVCSSDVSHSFSCKCQEGYHGITCQAYDPCSQSPCQNNAHCINISNSSYQCLCEAGYTGENCEVNINECASNLCENNASCIDGIEAYSCDCPLGYEGDFCEHETNECFSRPCMNGGTCSDSFNQYFCSCPLGYSGDNCEHDIDLCVSQPCQNTGSCKDLTDHFTCDCAPGFRGKDCDEVEQCPSETMETDRGSFKWLAIDHGLVAIIPCPYGTYRNDSTNLSEDIAQALSYAQNTLEPRDPTSNKPIANKHYKRHSKTASSGMKKFGDEEYYRSTKPYNTSLNLETISYLMEYDKEGIGYAIRICIIDDLGLVKWTEINTKACMDERSSIADELRIGLEQMTKDPSQIDAKMFVNATKQVKLILEYALNNIKIARSMIGVISNLMNVNDTVLVECDKNETITQSLVEVVHKYVRMVSLPLGEELVISTENIALKAMDVTFEEKYLVQGISFFPKHSKRLSNLETTTASSEENLDALSKEDCYDASINIPGEALLLASKRMSNVRVQFVSYQNGKFFRTSNSEAEINKTIVKKTYKMYQHIITAAIKNVFVENLTETVRYSLPNLGGSHKQVCVYWNPESQEWLQDGIIIVNHSDLVVSCESTHMTAFSVLLDPSPNEPLPANHEFILTIISYIGSTLSIFGLIFTILTYSIFRCLNRDRSGKILLNLCISLLFMNVAFLLLALKDDMVRFDVCMGIAVATHFFLLSSLMWMCVEALNMYQMIIMVFATSETHFMLKRMVCAWGLPVIIVSSTVIYDIAFYQSVESKYCFIRPRDQLVYNITYFGPACCLLAINVVVFVLVARVLFRNKMAGKMGSNSESGITMAQIRGAFTVMTLLGVTWTFGAFAFGELKLWSQYIFCISNSIQGFIIFVVRCVQNQEVRVAWTTLIYTGTFKKRRGPLPSSSTANSNSRHTIMSSTHSQSTRKTSLHNNGLENRKHSSFWKRFRLQGSEHKNSKNNSSLKQRTTFESDNPQYNSSGVKGNQLNNTYIEQNCYQNDSRPKTSTLKREMSTCLKDSPPVSRSHSMKTTACISDNDTCIKRAKSLKCSLEGNESNIFKSYNDKLISKSQQSLTTKEGEDTSWQFLKPPTDEIAELKITESVKKCDGNGFSCIENSEYPLLLVPLQTIPKTDTCSIKGSTKATNHCDQGYISGACTAEQSPESPHLKTRHISGPTRPLTDTYSRLTISTPDDLLGSKEKVLDCRPSQTPRYEGKKALTKSDSNIMQNKLHKHSKSLQNTVLPTDTFVVLNGQKIYTNNPSVRLNLEKKLHLNSSGVNIKCVEHYPCRTKYNDIIDEMDKSKLSEDSSSQCICKDSSLSSGEIMCNSYNDGTSCTPVETRKDVSRPQSNKNLRITRSKEVF